MMTAIRFRKKANVPYKPQYKANPIFSQREHQKETFSLEKLRMPFRSEGCKQK
jgi:hypothetical protein